MCPKAKKQRKLEIPRGLRGQTRVDFNYICVVGRGMSVWVCAVEQQCLRRSEVLTSLGAGVTGIELGSMGRAEYSVNLWAIPLAQHHHSQVFLDNAIYDGLSSEDTAEVSLSLLTSAIQHPRHRSVWWNVSMLPVPVWIKTDNSTKLGGATASQFFWTHLKCPTWGTVLLPDMDSSS